MKYTSRHPLVCLGECWTFLILRDVAVDLDAQARVCYGFDPAMHDRIILEQLHGEISVQMARDKVVGFDLAHGRFIAPANIHDGRAARAEMTPGWRVCRAGDIPFQHDALALRLDARIGDWHG